MRCRSRPDDGLVKPKHVGALTVYFKLNFNILKQINFALVGLIKDWIISERAVQLWEKKGNDVFVKNIQRTSLIGDMFICYYRYNT